MLIYNRIHWQCWSLKNNCSLYSTVFYLFLTLVFYKIGSVEIQAESLSQTSLFPYKLHEGDVSPPGRLKTPAKLPQQNLHAWSGQGDKGDAAVQTGTDSTSRGSELPKPRLCSGHISCQTFSLQRL